MTSERSSVSSGKGKEVDSRRQGTWIKDHGLVIRALARDLVGLVKIPTSATDSLCNPGQVTSAQSLRDIEINGS